MKLDSKLLSLDFPGGSVVNLPASAGDAGSTPDSGRAHVLWSSC